MQTYPVITPIEHGTTNNDHKRYESGTTIDLEKKHAEPLLACGAIGEAIADVVPVEDDGKASFGLTVAQLKEALEARGIEYPANANKAALTALLDAAPAA